MNRQLNFEKVDETYTEQSVVMAHLPDTDSTMAFVLDEADECIRVNTANFNHQYDLPHMINEIVKQSGYTDIRFMDPNEQKHNHGTPLFDLLEPAGFYLTSELMADNQEMVQYRGEWELMEEQEENGATT